ncbi:MAG: ABC transporter ATP-binding protein [Alphaproteobacteria bacterium]
MLELVQTGDAACEETSSLLPCDVRGLCFEAGGKRLIDAVDLNLTAGPMTMIMGPNGAGKTLLVRLLHGMIEPARGQILWGGRSLDEATRKRQAMVFQTPVLLRRSVAANIEFVLKLHRQSAPLEVEETLQLAGLADKASQPARLLSGGERQRLAIARALATNPDVLFLDEPTASLDPASTLAIEEIAGQARDRGTKIVFITHDVGQARRLADEVIFMHHGRVVEQARAAEFFDNPGSSQARDYLAGKIVL